MSNNKDARDILILGSFMVICAITLVMVFGTAVYRERNLQYQVERLSEQDVTIRGVLAGMTMTNIISTMSPTYGYFSKSSGGGSQAIQSMAIRHAYFAGCFNYKFAYDAADCIGKSVVISAYGYMPTDGKGEAECGTAFIVPKMAQLCAVTIKMYGNNKDVR